MPLIYEFVPFDISLSLHTRFPRFPMKSIQRPHVWGLKLKELNLQSKTLLHFCKWMNSFGFQCTRCTEVKSLWTYSIAILCLQCNNGIMCSTSRLKYMALTPLRLNCKKMALQNVNTREWRLHIWIRLVWILDATYIVEWHPHENRFFNELRSIRYFEIWMSEVHAARCITVQRSHNNQHQIARKLCTTASSDQTKSRRK